LPKKALIEQVGDGLCIFRPSKALCEGNKDSCLPADCKNSIIMSNGLLKDLKWRKSENKRLKIMFSTEPQKTVHLDKKIKQIELLINQIELVEIHNE
jgi:hypothetical protein